MKQYEVTVLCCLCYLEVRRYTVAQEPPGDVKLEAHKECEEIASAGVDYAYAMDAIHGRTLEMN